MPLDGFGGEDTSAKPSPRSVPQAAHRLRRFHSFIHSFRASTLGEGPTLPAPCRAHGTARLTVGSVPCRRSVGLAHLTERSPRALGLLPRPLRVGASDSSDSWSQAGCPSFRLRPSRCCAFAPFLLGGRVGCFCHTDAWVEESAGHDSLSCSSEKTRTRTSTQTWSFGIWTGL